MPKLYEVEVQRTVTMMVLADDETEAADIAESNVDDEPRNHWGQITDVSEVKTLSKYRAKYYGDSIPWSKPEVNLDAKTVSEILEGAE